MQLEFLGATEEVTGSCHLLTVGNHRVLLDCGMIQGSRADEARNLDPFSFDPRTINAVVLSHSHIDHAGRLPLLVSRGYTGPIYTHHATCDLANIMLRDAAFINEKECEWENRKRERKGLKPIEPLYTRGDAERAMRSFVGLPYDQPREIVQGITVRLCDAGHILGAACVELTLAEGDQRCTLVYSGDLGHMGAGIMRDPTVLRAADLVVLESTYGDRLHRTREATLQEMYDVLKAAFEGGGNVLIPAFAVGRTQDLLYLSSQFFSEWNLPRRQIFLDSPLAIDATEIYLRHSDLFDAEAKIMFVRDQRLALLPNLHFSRTPA